MINKTHKEEIDFLVKHSDKNLPETLRLFAKMKVEQYAIHDVIKSLPCERCEKLEFMIENGLGEKDIINDITYPTGD